MTRADVPAGLVVAAPMGLPLGDDGWAPAAGGAVKPMISPAFGTGSRCLITYAAAASTTTAAPTTTDVQALRTLRSYWRRPGSRRRTHAPMDHSRRDRSGIVAT